MTTPATARMVATWKGGATAEFDVKYRDLGEVDCAGGRFLASQVDLVDAVRARVSQTIYVPAERAADREVEEHAALLARFGFESLEAVG